MVKNVQLGEYYRATLTFQTVADESPDEPDSFQIELQREEDEDIVTILSTDPPSLPTGSLTQTIAGIWEFSYKMLEDGWWRIRVEGAYVGDMPITPERFYVVPDNIEGATAQVGGAYSKAYSNAYD